MQHDHREQVFVICGIRLDLINMKRSLTINGNAGKWHPLSLNLLSEVLFDRGRLLDNGLVKSSSGSLVTSKPRPHSCVDFLFFLPTSCDFETLRRS